VTRAAGQLSVSDARKAYGVVLMALRTERQRRVQFLKGDLRDIRVAEIDDALMALLVFGEVVNLCIDAGLLAGDPGAVAPEQAPLLDVGRVDYP
jgi:hypothetical protein